MNHSRWYDDDAAVETVETPASEKAKNRYFIAAKAQGATDAEADRYAEEMFEAVGF